MLLQTLQNFSLTNKNGLQYSRRKYYLIGHIFKQDGEGKCCILQLREATMH